MSLDLLERLIGDIIAVTQDLIESDKDDHAVATPNFSTSTEKRHASRGHDGKNKHKAKQPMSQGVHRTVC